MKHTIFRSILCAAVLLCGVNAYVKAQSSSTEGREFWIALTKANGAEGTDAYFPYIAVSAKEACSFKISNPTTGWSIGPIEVGANSFTQINSVNNNGNGVDQIPKTQWVDLTLNNTQTPQKLGLLLESTKNVSVYVASRMKNSFDASNILPITALTGEYIIQDYPAADHEAKNEVATFVIVATENNTQVKFTPTIKTRAGSPAGSQQTVILQRGEVFHVASDNARLSSFTGTKVEANKKIAVFAGDVNTDVPGLPAARDLLYEQQMPTAFWGTDFVVTRSLKKDADRVRITALNDNTEVNINGQKVKVLGAGETFELELSENDIYASKEIVNPAEIVIGGTDAHYIQTSCPVAVFEYAVGNGYKTKDSENGLGDPSMIWISPLEQMIKQITFGVFATDKTSEHFVNIITETGNVPSMQLIDAKGNNVISPSDFQPVLGKPDYSYARKLVYTSNTSNPVSATFTLKGAKGFIAHVYGNGDDESYGYSVGSSTIDRSIEIDHNTLNNGDSLVICLGEPIQFATKFSSWSVDKITWDMGDGTKQTFYDDQEIEYMYDTKGWYDIIVTYSITNPCTNKSVANESMAVKLYVNIPDTIRTDVGLCAGEYYNGKAYNNVGVFKDTINDYGCSDVRIATIHVGMPTESTKDTTAFDSLFVAGDEVGNPDMYVYESIKGMTRTYKSRVTGCDSVITLNITILQCTDMTIDYPAEICGDETFHIAYTIQKGLMPTQGYIKCGGNQYNIRILPSEDRTGVIETTTNIPPGVYPNAMLYLTDPTCDRTLSFNIPMTVKFPSNIVAQKWNNVLAVYNSKKNGGYDFVAYQWFKNDSIIPGPEAQHSYYYVGTDNELDFNAYYYVLLTTTDGLTLQSCPFYPADKYAEQTEPEPDTNVTPAFVSVAPTIVNAGDNLYINSDLEGTVEMYSTAGLFEVEKNVGRYTVMRAPGRAGVYVMQIRLTNGSTRTFQIIVK